MKIENRQKFLLVLTLVALGLYVGDLVVFEPLKGWWKTRSQNIVSLRKQVAHGKSMLLNEAGLRGQWEGMFTNTLSNDQSLAEHQVLNALDNASRRVCSLHPRPVRHAVRIKNIPVRDEGRESGIFHRRGRGDRRNGDGGVVGRRGGPEILRREQRHENNFTGSVRVHYFCDEVRASPLICIPSVSCWPVVSCVLNSTESSFSPSGPFSMR